MGGIRRNLWRRVPPIRKELLTIEMKKVAAVAAARKRDRKRELDSERVHEILRDAVDLEPVVDGHKALAVPPDIKRDVPPPPPLPEEDPVDPASLRVFTVPNLISLIRLFLVPVFIWLLVGKHDYIMAFVVLIIVGVSDWADGKIARFWHVESKIGSYLDPAADRLMTVAVPISMAIVGFIPWWMVVIIVCRDIFLAGLIFVYERRGLRMSVIYLGKLATASLMVAFPMLLLAYLPVSWNHWVMPLAWAIFIWAFALYIWTGILYTYRGFLLFKKVPVLTPEEKAQWEEDKRILR